MLEAILPKLEGPTLFYLDAHWSGSVTGGLRDAVPLLQELRLIVERLPHAALLVIDDLELFATCTSYEVLDKDGCKKGSALADWREITVEAVERCCGQRRYGSFQA